MKRNSIIWIIIAVWLVGLVGTFFFTQMAVDKKEKKLWMQAHEALSDYFDSQSTYMDVVYSGRNVAYEQIPIPEKPRKLFDKPQSDWQKSLNDSYGRNFEQWKSEYGDIWKLYKLKPKYESENSWNSDNEWTGWMFHGLECINAWNGVIEFIEYPYQVGLKKQEDNFFYSFMPTVQEALNSAFEFETENPKSSNRDNFTGGNKSSIWNLKDVVDNEYFFLWSFDDECNRWGKESTDSMLWATDWSKYHVNSASSLPTTYSFVDDLFGKTDYPGVYNGYYQVYNRMQRTAIWEVKYDWRFDNKSCDLKKYRIWWAAILTLLMLGSVIPLAILDNKKKKMAEETLQERLKRLCNPQNFMKNYDTKKVETANALYQRLMTVGLGEQALNEISQTAITELGITLIDETQLKRLKEKVNPQRYMKPYNAEKVSLANELFARINKEGLTYEEYVEIEKESRKL